MQATAIPVPEIEPARGRSQSLTTDEVEAFRRALQTPAMPRPTSDAPAHGESLERPRELNSDFAALSDTQYGKL